MKSLTNLQQNKLIVYPNILLTKKCEKVTNINKEVLKIIDELIYYANYFKAIGLASNQIGYNKRIIVIKIMDVYIPMINPEIIKYSKLREVKSEGCLSLPGRIVDIERAFSIKVSYLDRKGKRRIQNFNNVYARIIQHEIDHLNGVLIIDYI